MLSMLTVASVLFDGAVITICCVSTGVSLLPALSITVATKLYVPVAWLTAVLSHVHAPVLDGVTIVLPTTEPVLSLSSNNTASPLDVQLAIVPL